MGDNRKSTSSGAPAPQKGAPAPQEAPAPTGSASADSRASQLTPCAITFSMDEARGLVQGRLEPSTEEQSWDLDRLRVRLAEAGYGEWFAPQATLESAVQQANNGRCGDLVLAERRDARTEWRIAEDRQAAFLTLHPAWGGRRLTREALLKALLTQGVVKTCIHLRALTHAAEAGHAESLCVARARLPQPGEDARFVSLVARDDQLALEEDEQGRVDLHHLHEFVVVDPGTPLLRRIPATQGEPGEDVMGEPLMPTPGRDRSFDALDDSVEPDPEDANVLRAAIRGHPVFSSSGVRVDPTLRLKAVDVSTGNIDFEGSVEVAGDVASGFVLSATGDILIRGMVEKADIRAGGNLTVLGGVMGEEVGRRHDGDLRLRTHLTSGGTLSAKFINLAYVNVRYDLLVREYALQCRLVAGRDIILGQPTGKGSLIGGSASAGRALVANTLGSEAGVATEVSVGRPNRRRRLVGQLKEALTLCEHNWQRVCDTLDCIQRGEMATPPTDKLKRLYATRDSLRARRQRIRGLIDRLVGARQSARPSRVEVKKRQHANLSLNIDGVRRYFNTEHGPSCWHRQGAELVRGS
ncbi:MAG: hypothetical protein CMG77_12695 [Marinimicrobium sp.]|nr:hypothetical protein [Marinimicrobium sp.]